MFIVNGASMPAGSGAVDGSRGGGALKPIDPRYSHVPPHPVGGAKQASDPDELLQIEFPIAVSTPRSYHEHQRGRGRTWQNRSGIGFSRNLAIRAFRDIL
jgi:hypothetical protein